MEKEMLAMIGSPTLSLLRSSLQLGPNCIYTVKTGKRAHIGGETCTLRRLCWIGTNIIIRGTNFRDRVIGYGGTIVVLFKGVIWVTSYAVAADH